MASVNIIVPFMANDAQKRSEQLAMFMETMPRIMDGVFGRGAWIITVCEQKSGRKFSRACMVNVGAAMSSAGIIIIHDVDVIPTEERAMGYRRLIDAPDHVVAVAHKRYNEKIAETTVAETYCGGVFSVRKTAFDRVNGMCNLFSGWGKEDDALREMLLYTYGHGCIERHDRRGSFRDLDAELCVPPEAHAKTKYYTCTDAYKAVMRGLRQVPPTIVNGAHEIFSLCCMKKGAPSLHGSNVRWEIMLNDMSCKGTCVRDEGEGADSANECIDVCPKHGTVRLA